MRNLFMRSAVFTLPFLLTLSTVPSRAVVYQQYTESFSTTQYKDINNTTAWWDTQSGQLKLFPFTPTLAGKVNTPDDAVGIYVDGDFAYVADFFSGLQVIDISDPTTPSIVGAVNTLDIARDVFVSGDHAYVADGTEGLAVVDIKNPLNPLYVANANTPNDARSVFVSGDHAYVADGLAGLQVIDITNSAAPVLVGSKDTPGDANGVYVDGDHAYVADGFSGLQVIDISDPSSPVLVGNIFVSGFARGLFVSGDHAFLAAGSSGLQIFDVSNPAIPVFVGGVSTPDVAFNVYVDGDHAYVADFASGLQAVDVSNPASPKIMGSFDTPDDARAVFVSGTRAYVADESSGLQVIDVADPITPAFAASLQTLSVASGVDVSGNHAYVACRPAGLCVVDISDPTAPISVGNYNTPGSAWRVFVSGNYAYVADEFSGLQVINISNPATPTLAGTYVTPARALGVFVAGDHAYVSGDGALLILDVTNPAVPTLEGSYNTAGIAYDVFVSGDHAFVADGASGLLVIDVSTATAPTLAGSYNTPGTAAAVFVSGDHAYVAELGSGLQIIDISNPAVPVFEASYAAPAGHGIYVSGDRAYLADQGSGPQSGLVVIDISNPAAPTLAGNYDTPSAASAVVVSGDHAFVADFASGLQVIHVLQREFNLQKNRGQSLAFDGENNTVLAARLSTSQADKVDWDLSANNGLDWESVVPDGDWHLFGDVGTDLLWRTTHSLAVPRVNPAVSSIFVEWLIPPARIDSIVDVPGDQGGWARIYFTRSGYDFATFDNLTAYNIHRRVDDPTVAAAIRKRGEPISHNLELNREGGQRLHLVAPLGDWSRLIRLDNRYFLVNDEGPTTAPPGIWEVVNSVFAQQVDQYIALVPTLGDSSATATLYTAYYISAHRMSPSMFYDSRVDSGYSVDNIPPGVPNGFSVAYNTGNGNTLTWLPSGDADFQYFRVYRKLNDPNFDPTPQDLVHSTASTGWMDPDYDGWPVFYKITAVDHAGNESDPASPGTATAIGDSPIPEHFALYQNTPNPFNPTTVIHYDVPKGGGKVALKVYDVSGRLIRTLVDGEQAPGKRRAVWNGLDEEGQRVASGVYFYRLSAPNYEKTRKMIFLQ